jgi:hypothetical protein
MSEIIPIGTRIDPWGEIVAIGLTGGERYYWLDDGDSVAMIPAAIIEQVDKGNDPRR